MASFRNIDFGKMGYESLRAYFSVNSDGDMSTLYLFVGACLQVLVAPFEVYDEYRKREALIASCKFVVGQLTNLLNYLFDSELNRISITQSVVTSISDPTRYYSAIHYDGTFSASPVIYEQTFSDQVSTTVVTINIPSDVSESEVIATVEQIKIKGIPYQIKII